jgi:hypothetical protein
LPTAIAGGSPQASRVSNFFAASRPHRRATIDVPAARDAVAARQSLQTWLTRESCARSGARFKSLPTRNPFVFRDLQQRSWTELVAVPASGRDRVDWIRYADRQSSEM